MDSDGNGVISREEFLNHPSIMGNPLALRLMEVLDVDNSGDINFTEFVTGLAMFSSKSSTQTKLKCMFSFY